AAADQPRVHVELAGAHRMHGQRVERIVLEHEERARRPQDTTDLAEQIEVEAVIDVMEHAGGKRDVEAVLGDRDGGAVEMSEGGEPLKAFGPDRQGFLRDVDAGESGPGEMRPEVRHRGADSGTEIEDV